MTDRLLLQRFIEHRDQPAFAELVTRHGGMVYATARRLAGEDADDIAQAVFLLLSRKAGGLARHQNLAGWLYETTRRCAANVLRQRRRRVAKIQAAREAAMSSSTTPTDNTLLLEQLDEGLSQLSKTQKQVLLMRYMENLSVEETAVQLGLTAAAVMKRSTRGLSRMREYFQRRGTTTTLQGVAGCMVSQTVKLPEAEHLRLASVGGGGAAVNAIKLASSTGLSMSIAMARTIGLAAIITIAAAVVVVKIAGGGPPPVTQSVTPAIATTLPALRPPTAGDPRATADDFLAALRDANTDEVARYVPPSDDARSRAIAKGYIDGFRNSTYAAFPQRLAVQNCMTMQDNDAKHTITGGSFDTLSPIDADAGHLSLAVGPIGGRWYVTSAIFTDNEAMYVAASKSDLVASRATADPFDYTKAIAAYTELRQLSRDEGDINALKETDIPRLVGVMGQLKKALQSIAETLKGSDLAPSDEDIQAFENEVDRMAAAMKQDGVAGIGNESALCKQNPKFQGAMQRIMNLGDSLNDAADAQSEAHHAEARQVSVEPDQKLVDGHNQITIPGPLKFPEWLRSANAYKRWQTTHDIRTFITRDDAGNIYVVAASGWVKDASGATHEVISQIRMYRADKTLAEITNWNFMGDLAAWKTLDATGKRFVWAIMTFGDHPRTISQATHFDKDGNELVYQLARDGKVVHMHANAIGE